MKTILADIPPSRLRRTTRAAALVSVGMALATALGPRTASADESAERSRQADQLFYEGAQRMAEDRLDEACPMLEESYRLRPAPGTLFTLAECEARWGKLARALRHYKEYLYQFEAMTPAQQEGQRGRERIAREKRKALEPHVPTLIVELDSSVPSGSAVWLDERLLQPLEVGASLLVDPGEHTLSLQAPGSAEMKQSILIAVGEAKTVTFGRPRPAPARPALDAARPRHDIREEGAEGAGKSTAILVGGALVSLAAVGTGMGLWLVSDAKLDVLKEKAADARSQGVGCKEGTAGSYEAFCRELGDEAASIERLRYLGVGAIALGSAVGLGTVVYMLWPTSKPEPRAAVRVEPVMTGSVGGLRLKGSF